LHPVLWEAPRVLIDNPPPWPNCARCAVAITFDFDADSLLHNSRPDDAGNYLSVQSFLRYGAQVAVPRICRVFRELGLRQTFFVPGWCVERYPEALRAIVEGGHEIGHHGYLHEPPNRYSAEEERYWFERALAVYERQLGIRPRGYRAPLNEFSKHSLNNLIEAGIEYDSSLMGDDIPYLLASPGQAATIVEIPQCITMDDWPQFMHSWDLNYEMPVASPQRAKEVYLSEFDAMWEGGGMWMTVWHPFLTGRPARLGMLIEMVEYMRAKGGVWFATLGDINDHVRRCLEDGRWSPRVDTVPFDDSPIAELARANSSGVVPS
jgi:peptidoglycan-N-acetylglucosamine deacetylase